MIKFRERQDRVSPPTEAAGGQLRKPRRSRPAAATRSPFRSHRRAGRSCAAALKKGFQLRRRGAVKPRRSLASLRFALPSTVACVRLKPTRAHQPCRCAPAPLRGRRPWTRYRWIRVHRLTPWRVLPSAADNRRAARSSEKA